MVLAEGNMHTSERCQVWQDGPTLFGEASSGQALPPGKGGREEKQIKARRRRRERTGWRAPPSSPELLRAPPKRPETPWGEAAPPSSSE
eukprot:6343208-Pyramimonas_sp.AAC.1